MTTLPARRCMRQRLHLTATTAEYR
jgi:hypothetical protein